MGGSTQQKQQTDSTSNTAANSAFNNNAQQNPYGPAINPVSDLINQVNYYKDQTGVSGPQSAAFAGLMGNAQAGNPYAGQIGSLASNLLNGGGPDRSGYSTGALSSLQNSLNPIANQSTNPYDNQAFQNLTNTLSNDTADRVKSAYTGAGYTAPLTGDFAQQLGRGISQGVAPAFVQAQDSLTNQRMGAANSLYGAGNATAGLLSGLDQTRLGNQQAGVGVSSAALQANDSPYQRMLDISQQQHNLPLQNIGSVESLLLPMAQLGGSSTTGGTSNTNANTVGSSTMTGQTQVPMGQQILGGALGGLGLLGGLGGFGPTGWMYGSGAGGGGLLNGLFGGR